MPRKASDQTITHRIELGITERKELDRVITDVARQSKINTVSNTITGVAAGLGGAGLLIAGFALSAFLAPKLIQETYNKVKDKVNTVTETITAPIADPVVDTIKNDYITAYQTVAQYRTRVNQFCTPSSIDYDEQKCAIAQNNLELAKENLQANKDRLDSIKQEFKDLSVFDYVNPFSTLLGFANAAKIEQKDYEYFEVIMTFPTGQKLVDTTGDGQADTFLWS